MEYRRGSHTKFKIEYHFVWVTKYRYQVLQGDLALRVRELVRQTCEYFEIQILRGVVSQDHVHILVSAPPTISPSDIMRRIKGRVSQKIFSEFPHLKKRYWDGIFGLVVIFVSLLVSLPKKLFENIWDIILRKTPMISLISNELTGQGPV